MLVPMSETETTTNALEVARDLVESKLGSLLSCNPQFRRNPSAYTFNVKYYAGESTGFLELKPKIHVTVGESPGYSLYFHYPYCKYACRFCHYPIRRLGTTLNGVNRLLVNSLIRHLEILLEHFPALRVRNVSSVYLGGGTPTLLSGVDLVQFANALRERANISREAEWTIETTPDTVDDALIRGAIDAGFNRISTGVQVLDDRVLSAFRRGHSVAQAVRALEKLKSFEGISVNADLMYALPGVTSDKFLQDVAMLAGMGIDSITLYRLRLGRRDERVTSLFADFKSASGNFPTQIETLIQNVAAREFLSAQGYDEAPLGWFTLGNKTCKCYRDRWLDEVPLLGVGMSAYSYGAGWQFLNLPDLAAWQTSVQEGKLPYSHGSNFTSKEVMLRSIAFRLRYSGTVDFGHAQFSEQATATARQMEELGIARFEGTTLRLTETGKPLIDEVIDEFFQGHTSAPEDS